MNRRKITVEDLAFDIRDINGRPIRKTRELPCKDCGQVIITYYSDGSDIASSCKCTGRRFVEMMAKDLRLKDGTYTSSAYGTFDVKDGKVTMSK